MIPIAAKLSRASSTGFVAVRATKPSPISCTMFSPLAASSFRSFNNGLELDKTLANPNVIHMINYAFRCARTRQSVGSYRFGLWILKDYLTTELTEDQDPQTENSKGITLLATSTLMSERGEYADAIETLQSVHELTNSYLGIRVATFEAQAGLHLESGQDVLASEVADKCVEFMDKQGTGTEDVEALTVRAKALKGLIELVNGNIKSAEDLFHKSLRDRLCDGTATLSYGEFLQTKQIYSMAKEVYKNVLNGATDIKIYGNPYLGAGNINLEGLVLGAMSALGQLESHLGISRVIDLLKAPSVESESEGSAPLVDRSDIVALARGAYAEVLSVQENRKDEGEKMKNGVEAIWRKRRMSLADALGNTESNLCTVIDARISRLL